MISLDLDADYRCSICDEVQRGYGLYVPRQYAGQVQQFSYLECEHCIWNRMEEEFAEGSK